MKRILLIEDDASQRQLFKTALQQAEYEVLEAADGQAGLQIYRHPPCDVIMTDLFMPNTDGLETIFDLKAQQPQVKIIAISGGGSWTPHGETFGADEPLEMAARFGADRTLKKPIKIRQLLEVIAEVLERLEESETRRATLSHDVSQKRILVIEDDVPQRCLFKTTLENA
jgi:CheY-like chemotaxis protein